MPSESSSQSSSRKRKQNQRQGYGATFPENSGNDQDRESRAPHAGQDDNLDEQTPLLNRQDSTRSSQSADGDSDAASTSSGDSDVDLGDFGLQPSFLAKVISNKAVQALSEGIQNKEAGSLEESLFDALQSDPKQGLKQDQCSEEGSEERLRVYGKNQLPEKQLKSFWKFLVEAFNDKVLIILTIAAAISFALGIYQDFGPQHDPDEPRVQWVEGVAIMTAIVIVTVTSSVNDYSKERQFKALHDSKDVPEVQVIRDGKKYKIIKSNEVMVGDIVHIEAGDLLTCDGILLNAGHDVKVDESDATGESDAIAKTPLDSIAGDHAEGSGEDEADSAKNKKPNGTKKKSKKADPFLLSGSKVLEGKGHFLVLAVGTKSFQGKIFMSLRSSEPSQTKMQKSLSNLAEGIAKIASFFGALLFLCLFIRNCVELKTKPDRTPAEKGQGFIQSFVIAVTLIVVAVPEGLPLAVTLALAFATNRMTQHNLLVRVFEACETMSNANVVVTDKTGTLTANEMRVVEGTLGNTAFSLRSKDDQDQDSRTSNESDAAENEEDDGPEGRKDPDTGDALDPKGLVELLKGNKQFTDILAESISINSTAFEEHKEQEKKKGENGKKNDKKAPGKGKDRSHKKTDSSGDSDEEEEEDFGPRYVGNKTESALLRFMEVDLEDLKTQSYADYRDEAETVLMIPFSSTRKAMATAVKLKSSDQKAQYRLYVKGAAEVIAGLCTKQAKLKDNNGEGGDGESDEIETEDVDEEEVQKLIESYANGSLRTIALAYRDFEDWPPSGASKAEGNDDEEQEAGQVKYEDIAKELTLLAIPGIEDPLREGVKNAVSDCRTAGVAVKMCTGDNILTAKAIAKQCGIYTDGEVISGGDWRKLSDEEKREKATKIQVMARSLPQDKESLVKALQDDGEIVGVTGDGTNDALALKVGDVGFSMGLAGTEVAKEASDVIIMDDNFTSIVGAITWGRCVSDAVRKFLQFQLAVNVTAIVITFVSSVTGGDENSVLNAVQLLWVNLIMDTFAALALATDPADRSLLYRKPEPRDSPIISAGMTKMIAAQALYQTAVTLILHFTGPRILRPITGGKVADDTRFGTMVFNVFVWCQIFNMINCRQLDDSYNVFKGLYKNIWLLGILSIMIGGQILIVFFGGPAFDTKPISAAYWAVSIALGAGSLVIGFLVRLIPNGPLETLLVKIRALPDLKSLPQTRWKRGSDNDEDEEDEDGDDEHISPRTYIQRIREGRYRANSNLYNAFHGKDTKSVLTGLVLLPAMEAQAMAGIRRQPSLAVRQNLQ